MPRNFGAFFIKNNRKCTNFLLNLDLKINLRICGNYYTTKQQHNNNERRN